MQPVLPRSLFKSEDPLIFLAYICPGCLGVFDGPGACDGCGVGLTKNIIKVAQLHSEDRSLGLDGNGGHEE